MGLTEQERLEKLKELEELTKLLDEDSNTKLTEKNRNILVETFRTNIGLFATDSKLRSMKRKDYKQLLVKAAKLSKFGQLVFERLFGKEKEEALMKASEEEMKEMLEQKLGEEPTMSDEDSRYLTLGKALIQALNEKNYNVNVLALTNDDLKKLYDYCCNYAYAIAKTLNSDNE